MKGATLLDVNVLVALFDPDHIHHQIAHDWFADHRKRGWATCALTETGFLRVILRPEYASPVARAADLLPLLRRFCASGDHHFWPGTISLRDEKLFDLSFIQGHRQLTDVFLLGLAVTMKGRLATFDRGIPIRAVKGARRESLAVIAEAGGGQ